MILNTTKFKANALDIMVYLINEYINIDEVEMIYKNKKSKYKI